MISKPCQVTCVTFVLRNKLRVAGERGCRVMTVLRAWFDYAAATLTTNGKGWLCQADGVPEGGRPGALGVLRRVGKASQVSVAQPLRRSGRSGVAAGDGVAEDSVVRRKALVLYSAQAERDKFHKVWDYAA